MANVFFSYSRKDEALRDELEVHLSMLKREGAISAWHDRQILAISDVPGDDPSIIWRDPALALSHVTPESQQVTPQVTPQVTQLDSARRTPEPDTEIPHHPEGAATHREQEELAMDKLKLHSPGIMRANIRKLAELFQNCVAQGRDEKGRTLRRTDGVGPVTTATVETYE